MQESLTQLLVTKLHIPPARSDLVLRPRLFQRLTAGSDRKLTLISAPAGFGKTSLLSEWIHTERQQATPSPVAWLSLDNDDDNPVRFWRYIIAALQTVDAAIGKTAQIALSSPQPPAEELVVTALINDIVAAEPIILILDDYHVIKAKSVHRSLSFLLDHLPAQMHLIISTRADPPLPLARLRARSQLNELRAADLIFTQEESAVFLNNVMNLGISEKDVAALKARTEGWIAGLQLAALSLQGELDRHGFITAFASDDHYVVDYLLEEVLHHQPPHIQAFLLQTSILEQLCGPLCNAVRSKQKDSQEILDYLNRINLFIIPLDNRRYWYRYHHLFRDLLQRRLQQSQSPGDIAALHHRASAWYEKEGQVARAVSHALSASPDYAADLIERHAMDTFYHSEATLTHKWLEALPEELIRSRPMLCIAHAFSTMMASYPADAERAEPWIQEAEKALAGEESGLEQADREKLTGYVALFRAYQARFRGDDPEIAIELSLKALKSLPKNDLRSRGALAMNLALAHIALGNEKAASRSLVEARQAAEVCDDFLNAFAAVFVQTEIARKHARLHEAATLCQDALRTADTYTERTGRPIPYAGAVHIALGRILVEWNDLEAAENTLIKGLELNALTCEPYFQELGIVALARLRHARGDRAGTLAALKQIRQLSPTAARDAATFQARLELLQAQDTPRYLSTAAQWAQANEVKLKDIEGMVANYFAFEPLIDEQLTLARLLITQHRIRPDLDRQPDLQPLFQFLKRQLKLAKAGGWTDLTIRLLILQALAVQAQDGVTQAIPVLQRALALAEPGDYARLFVEEGTQMATSLVKILEKQRKRRRSRELDLVYSYAAKLLTAFPPEERPQIKTTPLVEPLSPRELELLEFIATGASNQEIAQEMFITVNTVKKHITHIFGKLGVTRRTQAVARARELGLIE